MAKQSWHEYGTPRTFTTYQGDKVGIGDMVNFGAFGDRGILVGGTDKDAMVAPIRTKDGVLVGFKEPVSVKDSFRKINTELWSPSAAEMRMIEKGRKSLVSPKSGKQKEPWEMTYGEYKKVSVSIDPDAHKRIVKQALSEGKPVPAEVLRGYPDLKKRAEDKAKSEFTEKWSKSYGDRPETVIASTAKSEKEAGKQEVPKVVQVGVAEYEKINKSNITNPNWEKANQDFMEEAKVIEDRHEATIKELNKEWGESFQPGRKSKPLAYSEKSDINTREFHAALVNLRLAAHKKYGFGNVPVSDFENKLWLRSMDYRTPEIDRLRIQRVSALHKFENLLTSDIAKAGGVKNLSYDKVGELDKFPKATQDAYKAMKVIDGKLDKLKEGWPANQGSIRGRSKGKARLETKVDPISKLQAIHDSRSPRSKSSDESQSNAVTIEPDDPRVEQWLKDQGRSDIVGIDTPRKGRGKKSTRKSKQGDKMPTQVKGLRR